LRNAIVDPIDAKVSIDTIVQWTILQASGLIAFVDRIRKEADYMSEKKTRIVTEESRYAVIEVRRNEVFPEHFVISYRDRESLRELIAAPSIIGIGFSSRKAAVAVIPNSSSTDADSKDIRERPAFRSQDDHVGLMETRRLACATLQNAVVAGVLMFYSSSVLGAVIRAFVGA
jgi:hypothetical protein